MRILVTGGAGFIASHLTDRYLALGHQVAVLDNLSNGKRENLNSQAWFYEADLTEPDCVMAVVEEFRPDVISHHAAQASVALSVQQPRFDAETNVGGMVNLLTAAVTYGVRRVLYASTGGAIYGETDQLPTPEDHPLRPLSPYGCSKLCGEYYLSTWHRLHGLDYVIFRYGNVYGPRQDAHGEAGVVSIFARLMLDGAQPAIFGSGHKTRDYVYVGDVVEAGVRALDGPANDVFNIATSRPTTDQQVFDTIAAAVGYEGPPRYDPERLGDLQHSCLDNSKARQTLGWAPEVSFAAGVAQTVEWLRAHR
jgi:UDP-glucose 4-epimerase